MKPNPLAIGFSQGLLHDLDGKQSPIRFDTATKAMEPNHLAAAYQISRQLLSHHQAKLGLTQTDWLNPQIVFNALLEKSRACRLRSKLASPSTRAAIAEKIQLISKVS